MSKIYSPILSLIWLLKSGPIQPNWLRADLDPRAEMGPKVGWNSLLIGLFWPKLCSDGSRTGLFLTCMAELALWAETDLFYFQCTLY